MKRIILFSVLFVFCATSLFAANFVPQMLKISAPSVIQYNFDGTNLQIPVKITGTNTLAIFCVYTKDKASSISDIRNGFLGWHWVNKVDTSLYIAPGAQLSVGSNTITWNGKDDDGKAVPKGEYTYYIWGYDNVSQKVLVNSSIIVRGGSGGKLCHIQEIDEKGLPLANPLFFGKYGQQKWVIGTDPVDSLLIETTRYTLPSGFSTAMHIALQPDDFTKYFLRVGNNTSGEQNVMKMLWVPNGESTLETSWGDNGKVVFFAPTDSNPGGSIQPGNEIVGDYLWTGVNHYYNVLNALAELEAIDWKEGTLEQTIDISKWWSNPADLEGGAQINGGPNGMMARNNLLFLNCHCSCIKQMVDPSAEDEDSFFLWTNGNGDYVVDHNHQADAARPWVCNDYKVGPYTYHVGVDANLFNIYPSYDEGAVSFGLIGPDGDGIGYLSYAGDTAGWKWFNYMVDSGSTFDGIYCDNEQLSTDTSLAQNIPGIYYIAQDSMKGVIAYQVAVEEDIAAFSVDQNSPNPFNPSTTISFTIPEAGTVSVDVFNVAGQKVATVASEFMSAGSHSVVWDASGFSAGVYFYTVKSGDFTKTMKMTLLK